MRMSVDLPAPGPRGPTCKTEDSSIWGSRTECHWHSVRLNGGGSTLALAWWVTVTLEVPRLVSNLTVKFIMIPTRTGAKFYSKAKVF